jgi:cytochrome c5
MSDVHIEEHSTPIRTPQQLIVVVLLAFLVPILGIVMISQLVIGGMRIDTRGGNMSDEAVAKRLKPVGEVALTEANAAKSDRSGEEIVKTVCQVCHGAGLLSSPKIGDADAWKPRISQGEKTLVEHAIKGIRAMPPRGGNADLSDIEVAKAVVWMANQSGGKLPEPAATPAKK